MVSRLVAGPAPQFASLVKGRWPRRQARSEGLPCPKMPPPEAAATRKVPPCAAFRERLPAFKQSPSLRLSPQPAPFDKGAYGRPQPLCFPCQREVARPQAVTEGLSRGQMPFKRSGMAEKFFFLELRLPGTAGDRRTIPRSPLSPPLTRGPIQRFPRFLIPNF